MKLKFTKMQGCGNDYVYIDCLENDIDLSAEQIAFLSDRRFGVGGDGVIFIRKAKSADAFMDMRNADGSRGAMCGNGIRCVAKYLYDRGLCSKEAAIDTPSGVKKITLITEGAAASGAAVEMGRAITDCRGVPVAREGSNVDIPISAAGREWVFTALSMGNPHAVVFCKSDVDALELERIGPEFERHEMFPERVNTEFVNVMPDGSLKMRVWERGSGETLACGTGACAVAVAAALKGIRPFGETRVILRGGELFITVREDMSVLMRGPAREVFSGELELL